MKDRKILVPLDGSPISAQTVKQLIALKAAITIPLTLLHVFDIYSVSYQGFAATHFREIEEQARNQARQFLAEQQALFAAAGMPVETVLKEGHIRETICAEADSGSYDLLVMGKQRDSELRQLLFGQVANFVVRQVKCPVLIV